MASQEQLAGGAAAASEEISVCVAVKIRPLVASEVDQGCRCILNVTPGQAQVGKACPPTKLVAPRTTAS